jgi:hypothetical protein
MVKKINKYLLGFGNFANVFVKKFDDLHALYVKISDY